MTERKDELKENRKASLTAEAALVLPVFIFAVLSVIYLSRMLFYEEEVQWALMRTGKEISVEYAALKNDAVLNPAYAAVKMEQYLDGKIPVSMWRSEFEKETGQMILRADYIQRVPFLIMPRNTFSFCDQYRTRTFTGVATRMTEEEAGEEKTVFVTETGNVYHQSLDCTYLKLSISQVKYEDLAYLRSGNGEKYYACEACCRAAGFFPGQNIYICNYGNRFHSSRTCKKIKRSIRQIQYSQVGQMLPCSKCGEDRK